MEHHSVATVKKKTLLLQVVSSNYLLIPTGYLCRIDSLAFEEVFQVGHKKWTLHIHTQCRSLEMEGEEGDTAAITNGLRVQSTYPVSLTSHSVRKLSIPVQVLRGQ